MLVLSIYLDILCTLYRFGACFLWDSGSSVGDISAQSKTVNSVTYKPTRPFRVATASEDFTCAFFEGPPFKFKTTMKVGIMSCHQILICCYMIGSHSLCQLYPILTRW